MKHSQTKIRPYHYWLGTCVSALAIAAAMPAHAQQAQQQTITIPAVNVTGENDDGSTVASGGTLVKSPSFGSFGNTSQNDIPFSVNSVPQTIIEDQQAKNRRRHSA